MHLQMSWTNTSVSPATAHTNMGDFSIDEGLIKRLLGQGVFWVDNITIEGNFNRQKLAKLV